MYGGEAPIFQPSHLARPGRYGPCSGSPTRPCFPTPGILPVKGRCVMDTDVQTMPPIVPASDGSLSTATVPALTQLETPALLVDLDVMEANIQRWQAAADAAGVAFRPHAKTHKAPAIAARQLAAGAVGLAVAKVAEAEVFAAAGCRDIVIAYPVVGPSKWRRLAELARTCTVTINVESEVAARGLSDAAVAAESRLRVHVEIDTGLHRCGVPAEDPESIAALCRLVQKSARIGPRRDHHVSTRHLPGRRWAPPGGAGSGGG